MKILYLSGDFPPQSFGGAGIITYKLALAMKEAGHEVFAITTCRNAADAGEINYNGITVFRIANEYNPRWRAYRSLYNPPVVREVRKILQKVEPDIVHAHNVHFYISYYCLKLAKQLSKGLIWTAHDVMAFNYGKLRSKKYLDHFEYKVTWLDQLKQAKKRWNPFRNFIIRKYLTYPHRRFAVSKALQQALTVNNIKNVEVLNNGIDTAVWQYNEAGNDAFRKKHTILDKKVIFFGGRLSAAKGGGKALEALAQITRKIPNAVLLVAGKGDDYIEEMKGKAAALGLGHNLILTGWLDEQEIQQAYAVSDVVLVPSICFDSFPNIVLEAMASAKPVVGAWYGGIPEMVVDTVTGYIVNPFNIDEMASKIIELLDNPAKAAQFGRAGLERVKREFEISHVVAKLIGIYSDAVKAHT